MRKTPPLALLALAALFSACGGEVPLQPSAPEGPSFAAAAAAAPTTLNGSVLDPAQGEDDATGSVTLRCVNKGTLLTAHFAGLAPKAVYTIWVIGTTTLGAAGPSDGSQNFFTSSSAGTGALTVLISPNDLGSFTQTNWPDCIDASNLAVVVLDGHTDGLSHGPVPGPNNYTAMVFNP